MLVSLGGIFIINMISIFISNKRLNAILQLGIWAWLLLLFVSVKFLPFGSIILVLASFLTIIGLFMAFKKNEFAKNLPPFIIIAVAILFYLMPTHTRYYIMNIKWNHEIETDYITWDKYSWFLYQNGQITEALSASEQAKKIASDLNDEDWLELIETHHQAIEHDNWSHFR